MPLRWVLPLIALSLTILAAAHASHARSPLVTASTVPAFGPLLSGDSFGPFIWRGGLSLASDDAEFGGLSGLAVDDDCTRLTAVSDRGQWFTATLTYGAEDRLSGLTAAKLAPLLDAKGKPFRLGAPTDAEALSPLGNGQYLVGFERRVRIGRYDLGQQGTAARIKLVPSPKAIANGPWNGELEAVGRLTAGRYRDHYIAIAEKNRDTGRNSRAWLWKGAVTIPFAVQQLEDYAITDLAVLPGGEVLTIERSFSFTSRPGVAIRKFDSADVKPGGVVKPEVLFEGRVPFYVIDNMEGIAICNRNGERRLTLLSDNNFNTTLQSTLLLQFAYPP